MISVVTCACHLISMDQSRASSFSHRNRESCRHKVHDHLGAERKLTIQRNENKGD
jgi:hypothetical protein